MLLVTVIGRLDYYDVIYNICSTQHSGRLLSEAMFKFLSSRGEDVHFLIFVPESLAVNLHDISSSLDFLLKNPEELRQQFHRRLVELMPSINHKNLMTAPTQSQGEYKSREKTVTVVFENTVANIVCSMFSQLLLSSKNTGKKKLIVDISTGQNLYVSSLIEAVRGFLVYHKLSNILQGYEDVSVKLACVPPIFETNKEVRVEFHPYDVKAFFELPIKGKNINLSSLVRPSSTYLNKYSKEAKVIYDEIRCLKSFLTTGRMVYNTIKYNTPLVLFHNQILSRLGQFEKIKDFPERLYKLINTFERGYKEVSKISGRIKVTRNYSVDGELYVNLHFNLAMLNSIYNFWKQKIRGKEAELEYINQTFSEEYKRLGLGLNSKFLERDCYEISDVVSKYEGDLTEAKLEEIKVKSEDQRTKLREEKLSNPKRNFFAHSGFSYNMTKVSKKGGKIILSYDDDSFKKEVMSWIDDPEG